MRPRILRFAALSLLLVAASACEPSDSTPGPSESLGEHGDHESEPSLRVYEGALSTINCATRTDTGYRYGNPFPIEVVTVDGKAVESKTANAYMVMAQAAASQGVQIRVVSGFRTMAQQTYLWNCYLSGNCNNGNLAARPGYSNHQSGHAMDLNTSSPGVYGWLNAHGAAYGFRRTVPSEAWHWEWWSGGPGGGPCASCQRACDGHVVIGEDCSRGNCGAFGATCIDPPNAPPQCGQACTPHCRGSVGVAADCSEGDCGVFGLGCTMSGGQAQCQTCTPHCEGEEIVYANCSRGDCAVFGQQCVVPSGGGEPVCGQRCTPHCEGSVAVSTDCSRGECGAFGANCVVENGQPTCQFPCTPHCEGTRKVDAFCRVTECHSGGSGTCQIRDVGSSNPTSHCIAGCTPHCEGTVRVTADCARGDCGAFGAECVVNSVNGPTCGETPPCQHRCDGTEIILSDCQRADCGAFGLTCADHGVGPQCVLPTCLAGCSGDVIISETCEQGDCGVFGLTCSTAGNTPAHCVSTICTPANQVPVAHDTCYDGQRVSCDASGIPTVYSSQPTEVCNGIDDDCDGQTDEGVRNACGTCGDAPDEVCNGADDDCDGQTDEDVKNACGFCGDPPIEQCNGADDDCDGETDEGFDVGERCAISTACAGVTACNALGDDSACVPDAAACDDSDPCTEDRCDPATGCQNTAIPGCCATGQQCPDALACLGGRCAAPLCATCQTDADCGDGVCAGYAVGSGCATACDPSDASPCPSGFDCTTSGHDSGSYCVATGGKCTCEPGDDTLCMGDQVLTLDACGSPTAATTCTYGCESGVCVAGPASDTTTGDATTGDTTTESTTPDTVTPPDTLDDVLIADPTTAPESASGETEGALKVDSCGGCDGGGSGGELGWVLILGALAYWRRRRVSRVL